MSTAENKRISNIINEEIVSNGRFDLTESVISADYVDHDAIPGAPGGIEGFNYGVATYREAFPDLTIMVDDMLAEDDKVVTHWTATGTHLGELMGIPATGKSVRVSGIAIDRCTDGKVVEHWDVFDQMGMLQQLGVVPA